MCIEENALVEAKMNLIWNLNMSYSYKMTEGAPIHRSNVLI